jgi:hypothetical protein
MKGVYIPFRTACEQRREEKRRYEKSREKRRERETATTRRLAHIVRTKRFARALLIRIPIFKTNRQKAAGKTYLEFEHCPRDR